MLNQLFANYLPNPKNHIQMPNGFGLLGDGGQVNTVLIVPFINDRNKYYLFTSKGLSNNNIGSQSTLPYCYSIVDMQLNGGLGNIVNKNTVIQYFSTEKMVAIPNANGNDIWWVCRDWTNHFYTYKITCQGFQNNNPVISTIGNDVNNDVNLLGAGEIKASPNGNYIVVVYNYYFELYQFSKTTGMLSSPLLIPTENSYGVEFSPDSKFLYVTGAESINNNGVTFIKQFNLANYDSAAISNSAYTVNNVFGYGGLQLAPNKKIYNNDGGKAISVINNPNVQGAGCNFQDSVFILPNGGYRRFPYSYVNLISNQNVQINYTVAPDCRTVTLNAKTYIKGNNLSFNWKFGDGDSSIQNVISGGDITYTTIIHTYSSGKDTFNVNLNVTSDTVCGQGRAGAKVVVKPPPSVAKFGFTVDNCGSTIVQFTDSSLLNFNPSLGYQWAYKRAAAIGAFTNFSTAPNPIFTFPSTDSFEVRLTVTSSLRCVNDNSITKRIYLTPAPVAAFTIADTFAGSLVKFTNNSSANVTSYKWLFGNGDSSTAALPVYAYPTAGNYSIRLNVVTTNNCTAFATQTITIKVYNIKDGLLLPNIFSPNGDNLNELFRLNCTGLKSLTYFRIFNRYGQAIYEQRACGNSQGWDGKYKGILQNTGAYIYQWQGIDFEGKLIIGKGTVMLIR
jgi:gliding motility-associated-like protein